MNVQDQARALSLARQPDGSFVLGERARRRCDGDGYFTRLLVKEECPSLSQVFVSTSIDPTSGLPLMYEAHPFSCACKGSSVIYRIDESLLRELLEEAGWYVQYNSFRTDKRNWMVSESRSGKRYGHSTELALAAMQALRLEVTV